MREMMSWGSERWPNLDEWRWVSSAQDNKQFGAIRCNYISSLQHLNLSCNHSNCQLPPEASDVRYENRKSLIFSFIRQFKIVTSHQINSIVYCHLHSPSVSCVNEREREKKNLLQFDQHNNSSAKWWDSGGRERMWNFRCKTLPFPLTCFFFSIIITHSSMTMTRRHLSSDSKLHAWLRQVKRKTSQRQNCLHSRKPYEANIMSIWNFSDQIQLARAHLNVHKKVGD